MSAVEPGSCLLGDSHLVDVRAIGRGEPLVLVSDQFRGSAIDQLGHARFRHDRYCSDDRLRGHRGAVDDETSSPAERIEVGADAYAVEFDGRSIAPAEIGIAPAWYAAPRMRKFAGM